MAEMLAVRLDEEGVIHAEGDKLIVGDFDIVRAALASWGGNRQRGRVVVEIYVRNQQATNMSPDLNGTFMEPSEPVG